MVLRKEEDSERKENNHVLDSALRNPLVDDGVSVAFLEYTEEEFSKRGCKQTREEVLLGSILRHAYHAIFYLTTNQLIVTTMTGADEK
ncbi:unnamed protein product [Nezara viridula]|uniref:Uncharacterized protein n=1 Tax=Nezara viridula TaxID=85310 RepID=A0A9P0MUW0_NEZVI|nr:unnamed protein product [Nezara viridula]